MLPYPLRGILQERMSRSDSLAFRRLLKFVILGIVGFFIISIAVILWFSRDLPQPGKLTSRDISLSTRIFDRNGKLLYDIYGNEDRTYVTLAEISPWVQKATVSVEDKEFYKHDGFDALGYLRIVRDLVVYHRLIGGSTLTQQLIKNTLLSSERTLPRKIKEFILATQVENTYDKNQILELYLNEAPYGGATQGIEAASEKYFGVKAKDLNVTQSAILAGLPQSPSYYSPYSSSDTKAWIGRTQIVLRRMREDGVITKAQEDASNKELPNIQFKQVSQTMKAPHFVFYVKQLLIDKFGEAAVENGGLQVTTTLDLDLQDQAQQITKEEVDKAKKLQVGNGAAVVMNSQTGEILSMVGSKDFFGDSEPANCQSGKTCTFEPQLNVATQSLRQPGSSIKPVTYATALKKGYTASTLLMDTKTVFPVDQQPDYIPVNYDGKYHGPVQMRFALGNSFNIPAVKMLAKVGVKDMLTTANDLGLNTLAPTDTNLKRFGLSITLGGGEVHLLDLTSAYSAFSNGGYKTDPVGILKVTDAKGKVLFEQHQQNKQKVLDPGIAFIISHMLLDNNARATTFGTNSILNIPGKTVAVKTGTTDDKRDNWTIGWTPTYVVGVWVGNNDNSPMNPALASGITGAAPVWNRIFKTVLKDKQNEDFKVPDNVTAMEIDSLGGGKPVDGQGKRTEYFLKGTEPQTPAAIYQKLKLARGENKLANDQQIASGNYDEKDFIVFAEDDPVSKDGQNRWQAGINDWLNTAYPGDQKYHPPTDKSGQQSNDVVVHIDAPSNNQRYNDNDVQLTANGVGPNSVVKMTLYIDGQETKSWDGNSINEKVNINNGKHKLTVKAKDSSGKEGTSDVTIGVNTDAN